jgi:hypothetical protein
MRFHKLRIAWSVLWVIATVLLSLLWIRSYWWWDAVGIDYGPTLASSIEGWAYLDGTMNGDTRSDAFQSHQFFGRLGVIAIGVSPPPGMRRVPIDGTWVLAIPIYIPILATAALAATPAMKRFSLRHLLISMTFVAIVLGLGAWSSR